QRIQHADHQAAEQGFEEEAHAYVRPSIGGYADRSPERIGPALGRPGAGPAASMFISDSFPNRR
ncbi:MAG: hypothetical protein ABI781_17665, partial [Burkholderiales bacterium]